MSLLRLTTGATHTLLRGVMVLAECSLSHETGSSLGTERAGLVAFLSKIGH